MPSDDDPDDPDEPPPPVLTAGALYRASLTAQPPAQGWFSNGDLRFFGAAAAFYSLAARFPLRFGLFNAQWNAVWLEWYIVPIATLFYLLTPIGTYLRILTDELWKRLRRIPPVNADLTSPFFDLPESLFARVNARATTETIHRVGSFLQFGNDYHALQHTYLDIHCTKEYWIGLLDSVGARRPRQLALWTDGEVHNVGDGIGAGISDLVCKITDSYIGIGDRVFKRGVDFGLPGSEADVGPLTEALTKDERYINKRAIMTELIAPISKSKLRLSTGDYSNVHSLDIITVRDSHGTVKVLSCLLWTNCTTWTTHSCADGYVIDVDTETIVGRPSFYSYAFAKTPDPSKPSLVGMKVPGVRQALRAACDAHAQSTLPWLTSVGWDAMITDEGVVFFEGNVGCMRTPRYIFMLREVSLNAWIDEFGIAPRTDGKSILPARKAQRPHAAQAASTNAKSPTKKFS
eukprot:scaffold196779_cov28-Tisochrysis_lutea.AAC.1